MQQPKNPTALIWSGVNTDRESSSQSTGSLDFDICLCASMVDRVRTNRIYAQNLYAALCNTVWQRNDPWYILQDKTWSCTWRHAGAIVADIMGSGDYLDWYCSGSMTSHPDDDLGTASYKLDQGMVAEGTITDQIRQHLHALGWRAVD